MGVRRITHEICLWSTICTAVLVLTTGCRNPGCLGGSCAAPPYSAPAYQASAGQASQPSPSDRFVEPSYAPQGSGTVNQGAGMR